MSLPKVHAAHETVDIGGSLFDVRVYTRAEAAAFQKMLEEGISRDLLEIKMIAAATDTPEAETKDWYSSTPSWVVEELMEHIKRVSRLTGEAQKSSGAGDSTGGG